MNRTRNFILFSLLSLAAAGCTEAEPCASGGADRGIDRSVMDAGAPDTRAATRQATDQELVNACVRLTACGITPYSRIRDCASAYLDLHAPLGLGPIYDLLHQCVNAAKGDCEAVAKCAGRRGTCDFNTKASCEGDVAVSCDLLDKRVYAVNCASAGLKCGIASGQTNTASCTPGACASGTKNSCSGEKLLSCSSGLVQVHDCLTDGKFCRPGDPKNAAACRGNRRQACSSKGYKPSCLGSVAVTCLLGHEQWTDCARRKLVTTACNAGACANKAKACTDAFDRCSGEALEACMDGAWHKVPCKPLGLAKCRVVNLSARCGDPADKKPAP